MSDLEFLIPWRDSGCPERRRSLELLRGYYGEHGRVVLGDSDPGEPFNVSAARNAAAVAATSDVLVFLDADALVDVAQVRAAVDIARAVRGLVKPFRWAGYLDEVSTRGVWESGVFPVQPRWLSPVAEGFCGLGWVLSREVFDAVGGFDPVFSGYGGEDNAFQAAVELWSGHPQVLVPGWAYSLWHPAERVTSPQNWDRARAYWSLSNVDEYRRLRGAAQ